MVVAVSMDIRNAFRTILFSTTSSSADETPPPAFVHVSVPLASVVSTWFSEPRDVGYVYVAEPDVRVNADVEFMPDSVSVSVPVPTWSVPSTWRLPAIVEVAVVEVALKLSITMSPTTESLAYGDDVPIPTLSVAVESVE